MKAPPIPLLLTASVALLASCGGTTNPGLVSLTLEPTAFTLVVGETASSPEQSGSTAVTTA
jgi:hypothetical protein